MIHVSATELATIGALNTTRAPVTSGNLLGLATLSIPVLVPAVTPAASSLKTLPVNGDSSRDEESTETKGGQGREAPETSLTSFAPPAKIPSSPATRSGTLTEKSSSGKSLNQEAQAAGGSFLGVTAVDKILVVPGASAINSLENNATAQKPSDIRSNIEYSGEVASSQEPETARVSSIGAAIPDEVIGLPDELPVSSLETVSKSQKSSHGQPNTPNSSDRFFSRETKSSSAPRINTAVPGKASVPGECPAVDSLRSSSIPLDLADQQSGDQHAITGQPAKSTPSIDLLSVPILGSNLTPPVKPGTFLQTTEPPYSHSQHSLQPPVTPKDSASKSSQLFAIAMLPGLPTPAPVTQLPSQVRPLSSTSEKGPSGESDLREHDGSSQFATRSSPTPSAGGSSIRSISSERGTAEAQVSSSGTLAFKAILTPPPEGVEPTAAVSDTAITRTGSDASIVSSPTDSRGAGASDVAAVPDLPEINGTPGPIEGHDSAGNPHEELESHKNSVSDTSKLANEEHRPTFPGPSTDTTVVLAPAGTFSSSKDQASTDSQPPEKSESKNEINPPNPPQPTRDISVKVEGGEMANADIRLSDRGGRILVSVRSGSPELAQSLRADLGDLVGRLESRGYRADMTIPIAEHSTRNQPGATQARESSDHGRRDDPQSRQQNQQESRSRPARATDLPTFPLEELQTDERELNT